ncbi:MAG: hypothetical protein ACLFVQ_00250 [Chitinispirillaceae bacterium]
MIYEQTLFFFDVSAVSLMLVLAYLSKRLGDALQIKPYYRILFFTSAAIVGASGIDTIPSSLSFTLTAILTNFIRFAASLTALVVVLRYWKWLFAEFSKT